MKVDLRISGLMHSALESHLFPGDGKESIAIALCGRLEIEDSIKVLVHKVIPIPSSDCFERTSTAVRWSTAKLLEALETARSKNYTILKIHSHPTGFPEFSSRDDDSDRELFDSMFAWIDEAAVHCSAVMLPGGKIFGRYFMRDLSTQPIDKVSIVGDDIYFFNDHEPIAFQEHEVKNAQTFGPATTSLLRRLCIAVIGCSGTGSPTIEQLSRLGVGKILLVDPDKIEKKNLNRILNSSAAHEGRYKVDVLKEAIDSAGLGTATEAYRSNIYDSVEILQQIASCDVVFGCMDSVDGRHLLNQLSAFYIIPYFDLGVKLIADGRGGIDQIWGTVHYVVPGRSSLRTRGVYSIEDLHAASLLRQNPAHYASLKQEGYIKNVVVESPAVISVNMQVSSLAVIEFLARIHKFRSNAIGDSVITRISLTDVYIQTESEKENDLYLEKFVGRGDVVPFLNMPEFSRNA